MPQHPQQALEIRFKLLAARWPKPVLALGPMQPAKLLILPHKPEHQLPNCTLTTLVKLHNTSVVQGLLSKDQKDFLPPGHLTIYYNAPQNQWHCRFQDDKSNFEMPGEPGIGSDKKYHHLAVTLGANGCSFYTDSILTSRHPAAKLGLEKNNLSWIIGASAIRRVIGTEQTGLQDFLDADIGWIRLYPTQLNNTEIAQLVAEEQTAFFGSTPLGESFSDGTRFTDATGWITAR